MVALIYFFAAIGKIHTEWLVNALPLSIWFRQTPSTLLTDITSGFGVAIIASWLAFLFRLDYSSNT